jgi:MFS family permease
MTTESILVIAPYYLLMIDPEFDIKLIGLSIGITLMVTIPTTIMIQRYLSSRLKDRALIVVLLILAIIGACNLFLMYLYDATLIQYIIISCVCLIICSLLENTTSTMITKIIPGNYEVANSNAGVIITYVTTIGRVIGALMIYFTSGLDYDAMNIVVYGIIAGLFTLILLITLVFYKDLRVKAIARILRNRTSLQAKDTMDKFN